MRALTIHQRLLADPFTRRIFRAVLPRDKLPTHCSTSKTHLFVVNTDHSRGKGEHWICIYLQPNGVAEYFDSYGMPPQYPEIINFLKRNSHRFIYNKRILQGALSQSCGYFCLYYCHKKARGFSLQSILNNFRQLSPLHNDQRVRAFYEAVRI